MDKIVVLDCGSQFAHLIANRVRRLGVYTEIRESDVPLEELKNYKGIIISGGPTSVTANGAPQVHTGIYELGIPILGVCYGHQIIAHHLGGKVEKPEVGEYGLTKFTVDSAEGVFKNHETRTYEVYSNHYDAVTKLPEGFTAIGHTPDDAHSAMMNEEAKIYSVQFHPEVTHSEGGMEIFDAFIEITGAKRQWSIDKFIQEEIESITTRLNTPTESSSGTVPLKKVFMMISGGVDSSVAYVLLAKAIGYDRIYAMYVDTGFMRQNETEEIQAFLTGAGVQNLHVYDAKDEFFDALKGVYEPEAKRKIIGDKFLDIQRKVAKDLGLNPDEWLLGQGTIYPDTIESGGTKNADKIKTHHNRVPEIQEMIEKGLIIEPLKELYKDEVRMVGRKLGLPDNMVDRHPFPGPGLAVRCLCLEKAEDFEASLSAEITAQMQDSGLDLTATVLPVKSVGVQGDERTYRHPVVLEGSSSYQTAQASAQESSTEQTHNWHELRELAPQITNRYRDINRVIYSVALKNGTHIESVADTPGYLTPKRIEMLQKADKLVMEALKDIDPNNKVWQCPTVLLPVRINMDLVENTSGPAPEHAESIVLRPVTSTEAMTANFTELNWPKVKALAEEILQIPGISAVFYDITNKPPGTIEWE
jgi:GMP synthase (glutamine-hydrolysing)